MALTQTDKNEIETMIGRKIKSDIKDFLDSTKIEKKVIEILKKELKDNDKRIVELATKCIIELYRTLWTRKNFWEGPLKNVR